MDADALVRDYLGRLEIAATALPAGRRRELTAESGEHIEAALTAAPSRDEVAVRNVLERLGPPEEIVAAEVEPLPANSASRLGALEITGLLLLAFGTLLAPLVGLLGLVASFVGLGLAWASAAWTSRQKWIATTVFMGLLVLPIIALLRYRS